VESEEGEQMSKELQQLIDRARRHEMSDSEREVQIRSFAYGNTHFENQTITREDIDQAAQSVRGQRATPNRT
jgi:hypothetical protein